MTAAPDPVASPACPFACSEPRGHKGSHVFRVPSADGINFVPDDYLARAVATPAPLDPYDMRIMVRALYTSGLTDEMNPSDRRKAALRLRATLQEQSARLAGQPAGEEPA